MIQMVGTIDYYYCCNITYLDELS